MWLKILPIAVSIARLLLEHKDTFKGLDKHQRKRVVGDAAKSAESSARKLKRDGWSPRS